MAIEDNQIIDRALDAAEAMISDNETVKEPEKEIEVEKLPSEQIKEELAEEASEKAPKAPEEEQISNDQEANVESQEVEEQTEQAVSDTQIEPPTYWSAERKALFAKAPKELQQIIAARELEQQQIISRSANELNRYKPIVEKVNQVFSPYELKLKAKGLDPIQATERLLAWDAMFDKDFDGTILDLMRKHGRTPEYYLNMAHQQVDEQPQSQVLDPRVDEIQKELEAYKAQQIQEKQAALMGQIEAFKSGKDSLGNERRKFVEMYEPQITEALKIVRSQFPELTNEQALSESYEYVISQVREAHGINNKPPVKTPEQVKTFAKKAKAAASGIVGAPASGAVPKRIGAKSIDEAMDRAERRQGLH